MRRRALLAPLAATLALAVGPARAEEGLFVARIVGGASTVHPEMPDTGGMVAGSADLCVTERTGVLGSAELVWHDAYSTASFGLSLKHLPYEGQWSRLYLFAGPAALLAWSDGEDREDRKARWDLAGQAGVGFEYLLMWGLGVAVELRGTAPAGLRGGARFEATSVSAGAGLFTEF